MDLMPQTEELLFQKINKIGQVKTSKVRVNDIELCNDVPDLIFDRALRSVISKHMVFRVKSTG
jgi:hypothetical protein